MGVGSSLGMLGSAGEPQLPCSHVIARVNNRNTAILVFTFGTVFSKLHDIFNTLL